MNKIDLLYGFIIGIATCLLGSVLFLILFTDYGIIDGFKRLKVNGALGKLLALGAVASLAAFFILLRLKKELMARGVILALIIMSIYTLFA